MGDRGSSTDVRLVQGWRLITAAVARGVAHDVY
jgi:hypothetical protein